MKIYSIYDRQFKKYGEVVEEDFSDLLNLLKSTLCPSERTVYVASDENLEKSDSFVLLKNKYFGGLPLQIGYCNGHNVKLNCLEYHKSSEINIAEEDIILLLGLRTDIVKGKYSTDNVEAFLLPKGKAVEIYANTLHYAPCKADGDFRIVVVLPKGTNCEKPLGAGDKMMTASNKWLLAHKDSPEAKAGAYVGLIGKNICI